MTMTTLADFRASLAGDAPDPTADPALQALWWAGKGEWDRAHACVQAHEGELPCDVVHAYLHRVEGDDENARYWYRRAGRPAALMPVAEEWDALAAELLAQ